MTRKEAITIINSLHLIGCGRNQHEYDLKINVALDMAIEALSERTGEWIDKENWMGIECSRCKCHSRYVTPFCPQCGARMKGADNE